ncbi:MAG: RNA polymerase sigma-70 factor (ECF subfamily) [Saprospiraceae bacterium]|jgi:RNA polymerase sigma-70 factor (ECF subfamily)
MPYSERDIVFDELLVMQYKAGDKRAMDLLMKRWTKRIVMYIFINTKSMEASKDIGREVWIVALKKIHHLSDTMKVGSWLLAIAHYKSMD